MMDREAYGFREEFWRQAGAFTQPVFMGIADAAAMIGPDILDGLAREGKVRFCLDTSGRLGVEIDVS